MATTVGNGARHALPAADVAWLHMDRPTNPMVVNALVLFGGPLDLRRTADVLRRRLVDRFPRFSEVVVERTARGPAFEPHRAFDLDNHLHRVALPAPGDRAALEELVDDLIAGQLDPGRPLWHAHLIEGYEGGSAVLWRIHHCIADGIALARLLLSITDEVADAVDPEPVSYRRGGILGDAARLAGTAWSLGGRAMREAAATVGDPGRLRGLAGRTLRDAATVTKLLASPPDTRTELKAPLAGRRRVAWTEPLPLADVKAAGRRHGATINDLLVAALAGALGDELGDGGSRPDEVHAMVPFNLRPLDEPVPSDLGNDFALTLLALPVGLADPRERLRAVHERMEAIKRSDEAPISHGILSAIGRTPAQVEELLIGFFTDKASLVVTNVPGPREPLSFAGAPVEGVLVWAPCSGSIGTTVSIFSYAGAVTVGLMTDTGLVPDPHPIVRCYERELQQLVELPA